MWESDISLMRYIELQKLINREKNQVFLFNSKCSFPLWFVRHHYFLVSKKGKLTRYEISYDKSKNKGQGHLMINEKEPLQGNPLIKNGKKPAWSVQVIDSADGKVAEKLIKVLEKSVETYQDKHNYRLVTCNCNTYAQRMINQVPECGFKLSRNAIGRKWAN